MMERGKEEKNKKGEWRNEGYVLWRVSRRGMERGKSWIFVWMRENEKGGWRMTDKEWGNNKTLNFFQFQIMRKSFMIYR